MTESQLITIDELLELLNNNEIIQVKVGKKNREVKLYKVIKKEVEDGNRKRT